MSHFIFASLMNEQYQYAFRPSIYTEFLSELTSNDRIKVMKIIFMQVLFILFIISIYSFKCKHRNHQVHNAMCTWDLNQQELVQRS